ncbi:MAG: tRNA (5-methylaminomethyl-2-thiouridine)(34)-methyltransferase MnmD [Hymenobacteraceae bacterium]|nr:tRNA (5-methylaminomethyl-2-thiouridine)(34)-methyltransferase MnmD [Hymenobacteraceae bacterium]
MTQPESALSEPTNRPPSAPEVVQTADGSPTLYLPALNEHYHSVHGARQESAHVFIRHGLLPLLLAGRGTQPLESLRILEIGLGTGLNALLTLEACQLAGVSAAYAAFETVPLPPSVVEALALTTYLPDDGRVPPDSGAVFRALHAAPWDAEFPLAPTFSLTKWLRALEAVPAGTAPLVAATYHLIYFDAFAPQKQPELWTEAIFRTLYDATAPGGVLVTYCAQGQFRRDLRAAGWRVEKLPGPPGKREMTRAVKDAPA